MEYYEDVAVGTAEEFGEYRVTKDEIVSFAERYDPQPFHVDEDAARESMFGELVASGWHTAAMCMRLLVDEFSDDRAMLGSPGVDELRWERPVRPGDTLSVRVEVLEKRPMESDPGRGLVKSRLEGFNQDDEVVVTWIANVIWARRAPPE